MSGTSVVGHRVAVIDLGTNTFNLLLVDVDGPGRMEEVGFEKVPVKLGREGLQQGLLSPAAQERALQALHHYREVIDRTGAETVLAYGTSALRTATNTPQLLEKIRKATGIEVQVISGDEEARLIYLGVTRSLQPDGVFMILDIGGGSNEFIIAEPSSGPLWQKSFPLGMARIIERFPLSDPAKAGEVLQLEDFFDGELQPLWEAVREYRPVHLVGASGTFDTLHDVAAARRLLPATDVPAVEMPLPVFREVRDQLVASTTREREKMKGMEPFRVEMIVPATIFVNFILTKTNIRRLSLSRYALKEGAVVDWLMRQQH